MAYAFDFNQSEETYVAFDSDFCDLLVQATDSWKSLSYDAEKLNVFSQD
ncbi:MAG: hypothetical protein ACJAZH_001222 [Roseivirga sp.]